MKDILRLSIPLTMWLVGFSVLYALQGLTCSRQWPEGLADRPILIAAWAIAVALQAALVLAILRDPAPAPFARPVGLALALTALIAAVWTLMPVAVTLACL